MRRVWSVLVSTRTTAILLVVFAALLLLEVVLPQQAVDPEGFARAVRGGPARFVLVTLGLGQVSTSVFFLASLSAFFLNLAAVLADRLRTTLRRVRFAPPSEAQLGTLLERSESLSIPRSAAIAAEEAPELLRRVGYRAVAVRPGMIWGVKHHLALLGFPVFHASFFLMCAGGIQLYLTRDVVTAVGAEGQPLDTRRGGLVRRAPLGAPEPMQFSVERVDVRLVDGKPVYLAATVARTGDGLSSTLRVNHPAHWGDVTILVERAGIAPVLWLTDARGFTLDRVVVPTALPGGSPARLRLGGEDVEAIVQPTPVGPSFPERDALPRTPVALRVLVAGKTAFEGDLHPGEGLDLGDRVLRIQEVRYCASLRIVSERGGGLLVAGFALSVLGMVWRMLWFRREIAARWENDVVEIGGRAEFFPARFRDELGAIAALFTRSPRDDPGRPR